MTSHRYFHPSNRNNAVSIMAGGMIVPLDGFDKHYRDLLNLAPGYVPLVEGPIGRDTASFLSDEGSISYPVLIEAGFDARPAGQVMGSDTEVPQVIAFPGVLPLGLPRFHFARKEDLTEFRENRFGNVDPGSAELLVSPELFSEDNDQLAELKEFLGNLPELATALGRQIRLVGAFAGAISMAMQAATTSRDAASVSDGPAMLTAGGDVESLTVDLVDYLWEFTEDAAVDQALLHGVVRALLDEPELSREAPRKFVDLVRERVENDEQLVDPEVSSSLARIRQLLLGEGESIRFQHGGLRTAKALLLYLLRPEPAATLTWFGDVSRVAPATLILAASFAGITRGYRGLPVELRGTPALRGLISSVQADAVNSVSDPHIKRFLPRPPVIKATVGSSERGHIDVIYKQGNSKLLDYTRPDSTLRGELLRVDPLKGDRRSEAVAIAERLGWLECIVMTFRFKAGSVDADGDEVRVQVTGTDNINIDKSVDVEKYRKRLVSAEESKLVETLEAFERDVSEHPSAPPRPPEGVGDR